MTEPVPWYCGLKAGDRVRHRATGKKATIGFTPNGSRIAVWDGTGDYIVPADDINLSIYYEPVSLLELMAEAAVED